MVTSESIDRSILWKKTRVRKDGNYDEVVIVKPKKNSIFLKKGKTVIAAIIQVENLKFF